MNIENYRVEAGEAQRIREAVSHAVSYCEGCRCNALMMLENSGIGLGEVVKAHGATNVGDLEDRVGISAHIAKASGYLVQSAEDGTILSIFRKLDDVNMHPVYLIDGDGKKELELRQMKRLVDEYTGGIGGEELYERAAQFAGAEFK